MFSVESLRELYRWMEWADASVWRAVLAAPAAEGDKKLREWLLHIHVVQRAFLHVWTGQPVRAAFKEPSDFASLSAMQEWACPYYAEARRFLDPLDASALARPVKMPWVEEYQEQQGRTFSTPTLAETIFQVASHSTYHRGQVNARLRELGGEPPLVDFIAWIWFGKPEPDWGDRGAQGPQDAQGAQGAPPTTLGTTLRLSKGRIGFGATCGIDPAARRAR